MSESSASIQSNTARADGGDTRDLHPQPSSFPQGSASRAILGAAIAFLSVAAFWPAHSATWVNWDDDLNLTDHLAWRGLSRDHWRWMFTTGHAGVYQPLGWAAFAVQHALFDGDDGRLSFGGYHAVSLALHAINAVLFFLVCLKLFEMGTTELDASTPRRPDWIMSVFAFVAALMFAVHPLRTECVAWLSCQPYLWAAMFALAAVWIYLHRWQHMRGRGLLWLLLATLLFGLSQLCKAIAIALPLVLLLLDVFPLRRIERRDGRIRWACPLLLIAEKLPMLAIAGFIARRGHMATAEFFPPGEPQWDQRVLTAICAAAHYVWKTVYPAALSPRYELHGDLSLTDPRLMAAIATIVAITLAALLLAIRRRPALLVTWLAYLMLIGPVLGIIWHGDHLAADRYSYLACMPWAVLIGAMLVALDRRRPRWSIFSPAPFVMASIVLFALCWRQSNVWGDSISLWRHTLAGDDQSKTARLNLGLALASPDVHPGPTPPTVAELVEARGLFERLLETQPNHFLAWKGLGIAFTGLGMTDEAVKAQENALRLKPNDSAAIYSYATALSEAGRYEDARAMFERALEVNPRDYKTHTNLGMTLARLNRLSEAVNRLMQALVLNETHARAWFQLGNVYARLNQFADAKAAYDRVLRLEPHSVDARVAQAELLDKTGHRAEALALLDKTMASYPLAVEPYLACSRMLQKDGRHRDARLLLKSGFKRVNEKGRINSEIASELAWLISINPEISDIDRKAALDLAKQSLPLPGGKSFHSLKALAAAYAVNGEFDWAVKVTDAAIESARADQQPAIQQLFEAHRAVYLRKELIRTATTQPASQPAMTTMGPPAATGLVTTAPASP